MRPRVLGEALVAHEVNKLIDKFEYPDEIGGGGIRTRAVPDTLIVPPPISGWTWVNQGAATETLLSDGSILIDTPAVANNNLVGRVRTYTAPLKVRARIQGTALGGADGGPGLWFRESSTAKLHFFYWKDIASNFLGMENWTDPTTFSASPLTVNRSRDSVFWVEIEDDNTDLIFRLSTSGYDGSFLEVGTVGRASFMAGGPDEWGWALRDNNWGRNAVLSSWAES